MSSSTDWPDIPERSLAEFFAEIESDDGPILTADDHRDLVSLVLSDREQLEA